MPDLLAWDGPSELVTAGAWAIAVMAAQAHPAQVVDADVDAAVDVIVADATTAARAAKGGPGYAWAKCLIGQFPNSPATHATAKGKPGVADRIRALFDPDDPAGEVGPCVVCGRLASAWWDKSRFPMAARAGEVNLRPTGRTGDPVCRYCRVCLWAMPYGAHTTPASTLLFTPGDPGSSTPPEMVLMRRLAGRLAEWLTWPGVTDQGLGMSAARLVEIRRRAHCEIKPLMRWLERQAYQAFIDPGRAHHPPLLDAESSLVLFGELHMGRAPVNRMLLLTELFAAVFGDPVHEATPAPGGRDDMMRTWTAACVAQARDMVGQADAHGTHAPAWDLVDDLVFDYRPDGLRLTEMRNDNQRPMLISWTWEDGMSAYHARMAALVDALPEEVGVGGRRLCMREELQVPLAGLARRAG